MTSEFIFYISVDSCVVNVLNENKSISSIAKKYPVYLLSSNLQTNSIVNNKDFNFLFSKNNFSLKMLNFLYHIRGFQIQSKYWIRLDADTVIFNENKLLSMIRKNIPLHKPVYAGVFSKRVSIHWMEIYRHMNLTFSKDQYIRGACSVLNQISINELLKNLDNMNPSLLNLEYDYYINCICDMMKFQFINIDTFEINDEYTGLSPCWHPDKTEGDCRALKIKEQLSNYENNK